MHADGFTDAHIHARRRLIHVTPTEGNDPHRQLPERLFRRHTPGLDRFESAPAVDDEPLHPVDEDVRHFAVRDPRRKRPEGVGLPLGEFANGMVAVAGCARR